MVSHSPKRSFEVFADDSSIQTKSHLSSKRPREDPDHELWDMITSLPSDQTQSLLWQACAQSSSVADLVRSAHAERLAEEASRPPVNFDRYSQECWYTLNKKFKKLSGSHQFEMMGDICETLSENREAVMDLAGPETRWETRRNALEVLRNICKSIMLCSEGQIRHEIMKDGMVLGEFAESMAELARGMTSDEREAYKSEGFYQKLLDLQNECEPDDMVGLQEIYEVFDGAEDSADEEMDEYDEETSEMIAARLSDPKVVSAFLNLTPNRSTAPLRKTVFRIEEIS